MRKVRHKLVINSPFDFKPSSWLKVARITFFVGVPAFAESECPQGANWEAVACAGGKATARAVDALSRVVLAYAKAKRGGEGKKRRAARKRQRRRRLPDRHEMDGEGDNK